MTIEQKNGNIPLRTPVETSLKKTVIRQCPECAADITLEKEDTLDGSVVDCPDCGFELETVFFNPEDPAEVQKLIKIAQKRGPKKGENYDTARLNLKESPCLIPGPREEEDWGE